jgi:hypothetical protein
MKKVVKIVTIGFALLLIACCIIFLLGYFGERAMINHGSELVKKVEKYKTKYNKLPAVIEDSGVNNKTDDTLFYYSKRNDSVNYIIWYGTDLGESKTYYSDSKKWEDHNR